jgi:hypothetical protein
MFLARENKSLLFWLSVLDKNSAMKIDYLYTYIFTPFFCLLYSILCAPTTETEYEKPGLGPRYTPIQAPVGPLLSTVRSKLIILSSNFKISAKS